MLRGARPRARLLAQATACLAACAAPDQHDLASHPCVSEDLPAVATDPPAYRTERLDVSSSIPICAGTRDMLDERVVALGAALDLAVTRRIPLILDSSPSESCEGDTPVAGCARQNGELVAGPRSVFHELAHGVACELGRSDRLYAEGFAVAFEGKPLYARDEWLAPISEFAGTSSVDDVDYTTAGQFVRWLHDAYGAAEFAEAYDRTTTGAGLSAFEDDFEAVYGIQLADAEQRFAGERADFYPAAWDRCTGAVVPWSQDSWRVETTLDCDDAQTFGPYLETGLRTFDARALYRVFTLVGKDDGEYLLQLDDIEGSWPIDQPQSDWGIRIERCVDAPIFDPDAAAQADEDTHLPEHAIVTTTNGRGYEFEPGQRYRVEVVAPMDAGWPRDVTVEFVPFEEEPPLCPPPIPAPACDPRDGATVCAAGQTCDVVMGCTSTCVQGAGDAGDGEPCSQTGVVGECRPELICLASDLDASCDAAACCGRYCSTDASDCPDGRECFPLYSPELAPVGLETLGVCVGP